MHALSYTLEAVGDIIHLLISLYTFVVAIAVLLSWVNPDPYNPIVRILRQMTEPVFARIRRFMPRFLWRSGIDFSPMVILFILILTDRVLVRLLYDYARSLG